MTNEKSITVLDLFSTYVIAVTMASFIHGYMLQAISFHFISFVHIHLALKKSPDALEVSIRRNLRKLRISKLYELISRNNLESPTFDPERHFIDLEKKCWSSG